MQEELKNILLKYPWLTQCAFALSPNAVIISQINYCSEITSLLIHIEPKGIIQSLLIEENVKLGDIKALLNELNEFSEIYEDDLEIDNRGFYFVRDTKELENTTISNLLIKAFENQKNHS